MARILFVDDEKQICDLARRFLGIKKHTVDIAHSYSEAVAQLGNQEAYDLLLVDVNLEGEHDGIALVKDLPKSQQHAQVIIITGNPSLETASSAVEYGAFDYLLKPFDVNQLSIVIDKALSQKSASGAERKIQFTLEKYHGMLEKTLIDKIQEAEKAKEQARKAHVKSLRMLAKAAEFHDDATNLHITRVGEFSRIIAKNYGLTEEEQDILFYAAPMHDVGKIGVPYQVLSKPGRLTAVEYELVMEHCRIGYEILKDEEHPYHQAAALIALSHHEKWDGTGYPGRLAGNNIPLYGRIVAVTDVYDALISQRVYKPAWPATDAVEHLHQMSGIHFDPAIVSCFQDSLEEIEIARNRINQKGAQQDNLAAIHALKENIIRFTAMNNETDLR